MRSILKNLKLKYLIPLLIIAGVFYFEMLHLQSVYKEFPIEKSQNPEASAYFIEAMKDKLIIQQLHGWLDYDNFIIKKVLKSMTNKYNMGVQLLPKDSAEDVYFWVILYRNIYGIGGTPHNRDMTYAYEKHIDTIEEYEKHYEFIFQKITKLAKYDVKFDVPRINEYLFDISYDLTTELKTVNAKIMVIQHNKTIDLKYYDKAIKVYEYFKKFQKEFLILSSKRNKNKNNYLSIYKEVSLYRTIIYYDFYKNGRRNKCSFVTKILPKLKLYKEQIKYKPFYLDKYEIKHQTNMGFVLKFIYKNCKNQKEEVKKVILDFSPELTKIFKLKKD